MGKVQIFISAVSSEFGSYRAKLRRYLEQPDVSVKIQQDMGASGVATVEQLADYVKSSDGVVHLAGDQPGNPINADSLAWLQQHYSPLAAPFHSLSEVLNGTVAASYTQWEAYLALIHGKELVVMQADPAAPRGNPPVAVKPVQSQADHLHRLRALGRYPAQPLFGNADQLVAQVVTSTLYKKLARSEQQRTGKPNNLPLPLGSLFKGRGPFMSRLREGFEKAASGHKALYGLGGIGKTRLAVEYAWQYESTYQALLFVRADTPADLEANLAALCGALVLDLPEKTATEQEVRLLAALSWLAEHPGWLLIVDNVDSPAAVDAAGKWLLPLRNGHVLLTTRVNEWPQQVERLELDVLKPADAQEFLLERTAEHRPPQPSDAADALALAHDLGHLALALVQAGAYVEATNVTLQEYRANWAANEEDVRGWFNEKRMGYPLSVAVTWQTSFDQLTQPAQTLLNRLAWFSAEPIPLSLLKVPVPNAEPLNLRDARHDLTRYSLATTTSDKLAFSIHKLVQEVTRAKLAGERRQQAFTEALGWVEAAFAGEPQDVRTWPVLEPLQPHALDVAYKYAPELDNPEPTGRLLNNLAQLLFGKALFSEAEPLMRRVVAIDESVFGHNHPSITSGLTNLAGLLCATNRYGEAEPLMRRALDINKNKYGLNSPKVSADLCNLGALLEATNRPREAELLLRRALSIDEENLHPNHPDLAIRLNNLAVLLASIKPLEAEPLYRRAIQIDEDHFGPHHPNVAIRLNNLAELLHSLGRLHEAEPFYRQALVINEAAFGPNHPKVAGCLSNLAAVLSDIDQPEEVEPFLRRALKIDEATVGPTHPIVAIRLNILATFLEDIDRQEAERLYRRAIAIDQLSLKADDPGGAIHRHNLAGLLQKNNCLIEAQEFSYQAVSIVVAYSRRTGHDYNGFQKIISRYIMLLSQLGQTEQQVRDTLEKLGISLGE